MLWMMGVRTLSGDRVVRHLIVVGDRMPSFAGCACEGVGGELVAVDIAPALLGGGDQLVGRRERCVRGPGVLRHAGAQLDGREAARGRFRGGQMPMLGREGHTAVTCGQSRSSLCHGIGAPGVAPVAEALARRASVRGPAPASSRAACSSPVAAGACATHRAILCAQRRCSAAAGETSVSVARDARCAVIGHELERVEVARVVAHGGGREPRLSRWPSSIDSGSWTPSCAPR